MKAFVVAETKFTAHGHTWIAGLQQTKRWNTAFAEKFQVWKSKKTWLTITCRYDYRKEKLSWEVSRYDTSKTRTGAAAMAAGQTREALDAYVDRLALYGDEPEKRYARMILKKKKHVNLEEHIRKNEEEVQW